MDLHFFRLQILKTSFEKNIHHSVDYEESIFTSEVVQAFSSFSGFNQFYFFNYANRYHYSFFFSK